MIWKSRSRLVGASAFIFITAVTGPSGLQKHTVLPNHQLNHKHITPVAPPAATASIKIYRYLQQDRLKFSYITSVTVPELPDPGTPADSGGALVMGGYRLAYRKALLKQAREEDEFLIEAITAIIRLL